MNKREAAIISAYTGMSFGCDSEVHRYIEEKLGRGAMTHEMSDEKFFEKIKALSKDDFLVLCKNIEKGLIMEPEFAREVLQENMLHAIRQYHRHAKLMPSERINETINLLENLLLEAREAKQQWSSM